MAFQHIDDIIGKKFWMLTILEDLWKDIRHWKYRWYLTKCDCGNIKKRTSQYLSKSKYLCCWGNSSYKWTHKMSYWRFYRIYIWLTQRCNNINWSWYKNYWWRWIQCERKNFEEFKNDMYENYLEHINKYWEKQTTIDRIDNDWNYCKDNCRRTTMKIQANNRNNNHRATIDWVTKNIWEWCKHYDIDRTTVFYRMSKWMSVVDAITKTKQKWHDK